MSQRWYLLRHGQTDANLSHIVQGQFLDFPLNGEGIRQAELTAEALTHTPLNHIYTSPAARTKQTAQKIYERHKPLIPLALAEILPDLLEINFGILENLTFEKGEELFPDLIQEFRIRPSTCVFPKGESIAKALQRVGRVIHYILINTAGNENTLIVSHGGILALIFVYFFDLDVDKMFQAVRHENCGLSIIELEGSAWRKSNYKPQIIRMNDVSHLLR